MAGLLMLVGCESETDNEALRARAGPYEPIVINWPMGLVEIVNLDFENECDDDEQTAERFRFTIGPLAQLGGATVVSQYNEACSGPGTCNKLAAASTPAPTPMVSGQQLMITWPTGGVSSQTVEEGEVSHFGYSLQISGTPDVNHTVKAEYMPEGCSQETIAENWAPNWGYMPGVPGTLRVDLSSDQYRAEPVAVRTSYTVTHVGLDLVDLVRESPVYATRVSASPLVLMHPGVVIPTLMSVPQGAQYAVLMSEWHRVVRDVVEAEPYLVHFHGRPLNGGPSSTPAPTGISPLKGTPVDS
jgi:hypothetical protein